MLQATRIFWVFLLLLACLPLAQVMGADATSFNPTTIAVVPKGAGGVPVGTVIAWPVSRNPEDMDKWLECDGRSVNSAVYPELFAVVGGSVPNYQGLFLRGIGGNSAGLGQVQSDAMRNIQGDISGIQFGYHGINASGAFVVKNSYIADFGPTGGGTPLVHIGLDMSLQAPVADEIRPVNKAVRYLIRAKP